MADEVDLRRRYKQEKGDVLVSGLIPTINESINNILNTRIQTRLFNRSFGSRISNLLFEPMSTVVSRFILIEVQRLLETFEPRVELDYARSQVIPDFDNNLYNVKLIYVVIETEDTGEYTTFLERLVR